MKLSKKIHPKFKVILSKSKVAYENEDFAILIEPKENPLNYELIKKNSSGLIDNTSYNYMRFTDIDCGLDYAIESAKQVMADGWKY